MEYRVVDADTHINEPGDLWVNRVPAKLRERAPKVVKGGHGGEVWSWEDGLRSQSITPLCNVLGQSPVTWSLLTDNYAGFPAGAREGKARIKDMDVDMVDGHVLYPTYVMGGSHVYSPSRDGELINACVRAYNEWMSDLASYNSERLFGLATLPVTGVEDAMAEAKRAKDLPGIAGILLTAYPNGTTSPSPDDEPFWSLIEDLDIGVTIHVGFNEGGEVETAAESAESNGADKGDTMGNLTLARLNVERQAVSTIPVMSHFILGGVLERHPKMRLGVAEVGIGWIPFFLEQSTFNFVRHRFWTNTHLSLTPKEYFRRQCFATFQEDYYGLRNRDLIGVECLQWSSDYPHSGTDWPNSQTSIANQMRDIPEDEATLIVAGNAARHYGLDLDIKPFTGLRRSAPAGTG